MSSRANQIAIQASAATMAERDATKVRRTRRWFPSSYLLVFWPKLPRHVGRPLQLGASLVLLSLSVLFAADVVGLHDDPNARENELRKVLVSSLAEQLSMLARDGGPDAVERAVADFAKRGAVASSVALTRADGTVTVRRGDPELLEEKPGAFGGVRADIPIYRGDRPWGELRIAFPPHRKLLEELAWLAFVGIASLVSFALFLGKMLVQLDPGRAVPDKVDSAFDLFSAGVVIVDGGLRIVMANQAAADIVEQSPDALSGRTLEDAFAWEFPSEAQAPWTTTLHSGLAVSDQQVRLRGAQGETRVYSISCAPIGDEPAGLRGVLVTLDDMTLIEQRNTELASAMDELRRSRDEIEVRSAELERLATTDPLTGVANRRTFLERLDVAIEQARSESTPLSCIMSDIDHFKRVNDTYGHPAGDAVICAVASALSAACREQDLVARFGGEEFVVLLPGLGAEEAFEVAERVRIVIIALASGDDLPVPQLSASFGVAVLAKDLGEATDLVDAADRALYVAKQSGRNRVSIYHRDGSTSTASGEAQMPESAAESTSEQLHDPKSVVPSESDLAQARIHELESRLQRREDEILSLSEYDSLTGVPMHELFLQRVTAELDRAARTGSLIGVMSFDLRDLRRIVARFGHAACDTLVVAFVERLEEGLRANDVVSKIAAEHNLSRMTSNEYGVLLSDLSDASGALIVVARLRRLLSEPFELGSAKLYLGANIGIALSPPGRAVEAATLYAQASEARLLAVEKPDKVAHAFASADLDAESDDYLRIESELHDALEARALELYFQPKFDLESRRVTGLEALLRWQRAERGFLSPEVFVAVAEANGLIEPLSSFVLQSTLSQIGVWRAMGFEDLRVSVNVSPMQLRSATFVDDVLEALERSGVPGRQLDIELTETTVLDCPTDARKALARLRQKGVSISIDDFGTGYTSLSLLADLPLDTIKIDRSLVEAMAGGERNRAVIESIVRMAHALTLRVVAEGVETDEQLEALAGLGCDEIQGYLISRPQPANDTTAFLVAERAQGLRRKA